MIVLDFYMQVPIKAKRLREDAIELKYAHQGDSGMDVFVVALKRLNENKKPYEDFKDFVKGTTSWVIEPGETVLACSGWAVAIPLGTELQVRPTSGNGLKTKIRIPNTPGTIDSVYRGEVGIELENTGTEPFVLKRGAKVAQLVLVPVLEAVVAEVHKLPETDRGERGYGSTGTMLFEKIEEEYAKREKDGELKVKSLSSVDKNCNCDHSYDGGCH